MKNMFSSTKRLAGQAEEAAVHFPHYDPLHTKHWTSVHVKGLAQNEAQPGLKFKIMEKGAGL